MRFSTSIDRAELPIHMTIGSPQVADMPHISQQHASERMHSRTQFAGSLAIYFIWLCGLLVMYCSFSGLEYTYPHGVDADHYVLMAQKKFSSVLDAPYILRWLTPWLVRGLRAVLGYNIGWDFAWYSIDLLSLFGCAVVFHLFLRNVMKRRNDTSTLAVLMLLSNFVYSVFCSETHFSSMD
jgi:hypothetical protein